MRRHNITASVSCLIFLAASALGLHFHVASGLDRPQDDVSNFVLADLFQSDPGGGVYLTSEFSMQHTAEHFIDGDVDVEPPIPMVCEAVPLLLFCIITWIWLDAPAVRPLPIEAARFNDAPLRPPRRPYLFPPANAPPKRL